MDLQADLKRQFLAAIEEFLKETGISASRLSLDVTNDPTFVRRLRQGKSNWRVDTAQRFIDHMNEVRSERGQNRPHRRAA